MNRPPAQRWLRSMPTGARCAAVLRLILSGAMERDPRLQIVHPHTGGVIPWLMGRIEEQTEVKGRACQHLKHPSSWYYQRVYLDLVTPDPKALRWTLEFAGPTVCCSPAMIPG